MKIEKKGGEKRELLVVGEGGWGFGRYLRTIGGRETKRVEGGK